MSKNSTNKEELLELKQDLSDRLQELEEQPNKDENEIAEITSQISDVEKKLNTISATKNIEPGTEDLVQVMISFGNRYSAKTGKEINKPQKMMFSFGEWNLFKQSFKRLGYSIIKVMNDPYNDAEELVSED